MVAMKKKVVVLGIVFFCTSAVQGAQGFSKQKKDHSSKSSPKEKSSGQAMVPSLDLKNSDVRKPIKTSGGSSSGGTPKTPVKDVGELVSHVTNSRTKKSITGQSGEDSSKK